MVKKILGTVFILALCIGLVAAEDFKGKVTKVDGSKVTVKNKTDEKTFDITGAKVQKKGKNGTVAADASAIKEGSGVSITTDGGKVTEVTVGGGKKQK